MPGVPTAVRLLLFIFVSSSEEKDGKTESKDEKGEGIKCFFSVLVFQIEWIYAH